jgi:hypothetical protein
LLIVLVLIILIVVLALAAEPYLGRVMVVLQAIALVLIIVSLCRYLGWL